MNLSLWIFFIIPCLELIATVILGEAIGFSRTAALLAILTVAGIILFRLSPRLVAPGRPPYRAHLFLFRLGTLLMICPGVLTGLFGLQLLFSPVRTLYLRLFGEEFYPKLPPLFQFAAAVFGIDPASTGESAFRSNRTWNPYGAGETCEGEIIEDDDPDTSTAYNGDIAPGRSEPDDEIIDVDYTVR